MHKSKATSTPTSTSSSASTSVQGSKNKGKTSNKSGSYSASDCESVSLNVGGSSDNNKSGVRDLDDGGKHDTDPSSVQSDSQQANRPPLDRQGEIGSAPLATFDTVDLSDEEVTNSKDTASANTEVVNNSDLPHASIVGTTSKTSLSVTTNTHTKEAASNELVHTVCSIPAAASKISTAETTTSTVTIHNKLPIVSSCLYKESHIAASSDVTSDDCSRNADVCQSNSPNSKSSKESVPVNVSKGSKSKKKQKIKNAASKTLSPSPAKESRQKKKTFFGRKTNASDLDGEKDSEVVSKQSEVVNHQLVDAPSSDDDADSRTYRGISPGCLDSPSSFASCKTDNLHDVTKDQQESVTLPSATEGAADVDFVNFDTTEDGTATPVATEPGSGPKLKDLSAVEKVNLLDDSSSSESDLSAAESLTTENIYSSFAAGRDSLKGNALKEVDDIGQQFDNFTEPTSFNSKRKAYERRLQRLQVKTTPINRPRSATPLSVVTLDEYTHLSSPEVSPNLEKLKIVLPSEQFGKPIKSPRGVGTSKENAFDFNEDRLFRHTKEAIVLQSDGSIGQSPRRIFIPPTLSPSQSPCKAAAGSPVSKLVLVSKLPAGTSPLVKSAAPTASTPTTTSITTTLPTSNPSLVPPSSSAPKCSVKKWEQFDDNTACPLQTVECSKLGPDSLEGSHSRDEAVKPDGKEQTKSKLFTAECSGNIESPLVGHRTQLRGQETEEEEEEILKVEIGSSEVGKAYNIELEVPTKDKMDISHNKPNC
ncbi:uncharacterized protein LOC106873241 [Octopus bimaculoides]|uniref:Uncharacterized protein n=1 Tax=Octopus bimaculoides TaxID=37653 RepID=A0A0L8ICX1_OCTBM|nr:uncharacterized protein LOC106873241 [Octopus bimaculoides]|eukprot:XP_014776004.1 PREDICTED: flocculation protein FLO11-like [Octopus bimaculoides]